MGVVNQYRLIVTSLKEEEGSKRFNQYFYFNKDELGLEEMKKDIKNWERLVHSDLYNRTGHQNTSFFITMENFKRSADGIEISLEIDSRKIK